MDERDTLRMARKDNDPALRWLVLMYQFPKGPDSRRVKVWRRLQSIGAVAIKHSAYALPQNEQSREDFEWLARELKNYGADCAILEANVIGGMSDQQICELFNAARDADYRGLQEELDNAIDALPESADDNSREAARAALARARKRFAEIEAIDFFAAHNHDAVEAAMRRLADRSSENTGNAIAEETDMSAAELEQLTDRVWVTRRGVKVDRIASAWLIRRWIDAHARFKFVPGKNYQSVDREIRFDMFEAEFTHEGDMCTFEVLARRARPADRALRSVADIVHDIDLKDGKFDRPETNGIASLLAGIVADTEDDMQRVERGGVLFEDLYRFFSEAST